MASSRAIFWNPTKPVATAGGIVHGDGSKYSITPAGSSGQVLTSNGASDPTFQDVPISQDSGSWTPTITGSTSGSGQTYSAQVGRYVRVKRASGLCEVTVSCTVTLSNTGSLVGSVLIEGLPFASATVSGLSQICPMSWASLTNAWTYLQGVIGSNVTVVLVAGIKLIPATSVSAMDVADLSNTTTFAFNATYISST